MNKLYAVVESRGREHKLLARALTDKEVIPLDEKQMETMAKEWAERHGYKYVDWAYDHS